MPIGIYKRKPSEKVNKANRERMLGKKNNLKDGKYFDKHKGRMYVLCPENPNAHGGYVSEHRLVMEKHIDRYLVDDEVVHHIDEDKLNNNIENLQLMSLGEHSTLHHEIRRNNGNKESD